MWEHLVLLIFPSTIDLWESTWYKETCSFLSAVLIVVGSFLPGQTRKSSVVLSTICCAVLRMFGWKMNYGSSPKSTLFPMMCTVKWQMLFVAVGRCKGRKKVNFFPVKYLNTIRYIWLSKNNLETVIGCFQIWKCDDKENRLKGCVCIWLQGLWEIFSRSIASPSFVGCGPLVFQKL